MSKVNDLHNKWMKDKKYRKAHEDLALTRAVIEARAAAGARRNNSRSAWTQRNP